MELEIPGLPETKDLHLSVTPDVISGQQTTATWSELGSVPSPLESLSTSLATISLAAYFSFPFWLETRPFCMGLILAAMQASVHVRVESVIQDLATIA